MDRTRLKKAIDTANSKKQEDYTKKSWKAMQSALKKAQKDFDKKKATQEEIDAAGRNPQTSDNACIGLYAIVMAVSALALAVLLWNRKRFME